RRIFTYSAELGLDTWNLISSIGGFSQAAGILGLITAVVESLRSKERAGRNPWGAATLEWATEPPPVPHNFQRTLVVHSREPLWVEREQVEAIVFGEREPNIHMPPNSYWPIFTAFGIVAAFVLFMTNIWWAPLIG